MRVLKYLAVAVALMCSVVGCGSGPCHEFDNFEGVAVTYNAERGWNRELYFRELKNFSKDLGLNITFRNATEDGPIGNWYWVEVEPLSEHDTRGGYDRCFGAIINSRYGATEAAVITIHEIGHAAGLKHVEIENNLMQAKFETWDIFWNSVHLEDLQVDRINEVFK